MQKHTNLYIEERKGKDLILVAWDGFIICVYTRIYNNNNNKKKKERGSGFPGLFTPSGATSGATSGGDFGSNFRGMIDLL